MNTVPSMLTDLVLVDTELKTENEVENLRSLVTEYKKRIRQLELELVRREENYKKPVVLEDGFDPHPAWDYVASVSAPRLALVSDESSPSSREVLANCALVLAYLPVGHKEPTVELTIPFARIAMALKGKKYCDDWHCQFSKQFNKNSVKEMIQRVKTSRWW